MDLAPLRHRDYRLLFVAQLVSFLGTMITYVALPYQMYRLTGSSASVGLLGLAELLPMLATAFVGGALADAMDRRRLGLVTDLGLAAGSVTLTVLAARGVSAPWMLYAVAAWMSAVGALQRPATEAMVPRLVDADEIPAAAALGMLRGSLGMIAGPAIGGVLLASVGLPFTYLADAVSYGVSLVCLWLIRPVPAADEAGAPSLAGVLDGFRYAVSRQELVGTYVVDFVAMVFGMPLALFPAMADRLGGPVVLGWLYAAPAVGALLASLAGGWTPRVGRQGRAILAAASVWGLAIVLFGLSTTVAAALAWLVVAGAADGLSGIFRVTLWNRTIPDALRGRLASIEMVSYSSGPLLGHVEAGLVAAAAGVPASIVSGGVLCVVGVALCGWLLPEFRRYDAATATGRTNGGAAPP